MIENVDLSVPAVMARVLDCCGKEEVTLEHKAQHPPVSQCSNPQPMNLEGWTER